LLLILLFGCTSPTYYYSTTNIERIFDGNISGDAGLIPFVNSDGNLLEVENGFDYNAETNTLSADYFVGDGSNLTGISSSSSVDTNFETAGYSDLNTEFLRLDTSNDPLTGDLEISKADPEIKQTDSTTGNVFTQTLGTIQNFELTSRRFCF